MILYVFKVVGILIPFFFDMFGILNESTEFIIIEKIPKKMKTEIMSLADRFREEGKEIGKEIGKEEGKEKGKAEKETLAAHNMLKRGFSVAEIVDVLEVSSDFVEKIKMALES